MENAQQSSSSFDLLHRKVQRWIWKRGWEELRDIQEMSIPALVAGEKDVIISAATAGGKTEAAFFPIVSRIADQYDGAVVRQDERVVGFSVLYISPMKALINDQFGRVDDLCQEMGIPVLRWHGDVSASVKRNAVKNPSGIVLITPESIEAILVRRGPEVRRLFGALSHIVIDEMHAFMGDERGRQLQSLLNRIELLVGRRIPRVGLSATLADMRVAADFLRSGHAEDVVLLQSGMGGQELLLQVRGYEADNKPVPREAAPAAGQGGAEDDDFDVEDFGVIGQMCQHLFRHLRGSRNLIFAGSRARVELVSTVLSELCEQQGVPNEFFAHHGSLGKEYREEAERRMRDKALPASIVCTTTLELGIDVGEIESVAQIGPAYSVAGMRQRLGRSGRRAGAPAVMRAYTEEMALTERIHPVDALRPDTVQTVAMIRLLLRRWNEPARTESLHLSTLVHQILAVIGQYGGITARQGYDILCRSGPFRTVTPGIFKDVLTQMGREEVGLLVQAPDGTLLHGPAGERITESFEFFAVFKAPEEYRVVNVKRNKTLGMLPTTQMYWPGALLILGGRRWEVIEVKDRERVILVKRARGGKPPTFGGEGGAVDDGVFAEMRKVYQEVDPPTFLNR